MINKENLHKISCNTNKRNRNDKGYITVYRSSNPRLVFNTRVSHECNWKPGTRVDVAARGNTFIIFPDPVGRFKITIYNTSLLCLNNKELVMTLLNKTNNKIKFDAWVEEGVIFFK